jgi:hypothetical protein
MVGIAALKRYGFDGVGEDSGAKKRQQDDAAGVRCGVVSTPATVGVYKKCGWECERRQE